MFASSTLRSVPHAAAQPVSRSHNRIVVLCSSINDVTSWPFWKFLQMKKVKGVTDLHMLAFNSDGGSFLARVDGTAFSFKNFENVKGYREPMLEEFIHRTYLEGKTYFVYGGHGMGDYLELEEFKTALQVHDLARILGNRRYEAILFDACFMSNLDCAYYLRNNTRWIGACEGYMWEEDVALDQHIFNTFTASAMSRYKDPVNILETIQKDYCGKTRLGDFAILCTDHVEKLWNYVEEHVWQRVYDQATFLSDEEHVELHQQAEEAIAQLDRGDDEEPVVSGGFPVGGLASSVFTGKRSSKKRRLMRAAHFKHALYPSEFEDKHLIDLRGYLKDIARQRRRSHLVATPNALEGGGQSIDEPSASSALDNPIDDADLEHDTGIQLLNKVVYKHTPPQDAAIYAAPLGGLSLSVHEFSVLSKLAPKRAVAVDRRGFLERSHEYLEKCSPKKPTPVSPSPQPPTTT